MTKKKLLQPGDVVCLPTSPLNLMVVNIPIYNTDEPRHLQEQRRSLSWECTWFDNENILRFGIFGNDALVKFKPQRKN